MDPYPDLPPLPGPEDPIVISGGTRKLVLIFNNAVLATICDDGTVMLEPDVVPDRAAQVFWEAISRLRGEQIAGTGCCHSSSHQGDFHG